MTARKKNKALDKKNEKEEKGKRGKQETGKEKRKR